MNPSHEALQFVPVTAAQRREVVTFDSVFTELELDHLVKVNSRLDLEEAKVGPSGEFDYNRRDSRIAWVSNNEHSRWVYLKIMETIQRANIFFGLDIWGIAEPLQYSEYAEEGRYCWHQDSGIHPDEKPRPPRKISFTLQLSHSAEYDGGDLQFLLADRFNAPRDRGAMILFPSTQTHRVNTVTLGLRRSLVGWATGPDLR